MLNAYCPGNQHITNWLKPLTKTRSKRAVVCCVILVATSLHCFHFFLFLCAWLCNWMKGDQKTHSKCIYNLIFPNVRNFEFWWILVGILESDAHKEYDYSCASSLGVPMSAFWHKSQTEAWTDFGENSQYVAYAPSQCLR